MTDDGKRDRDGKKAKRKIDAGKELKRRAQELAKKAVEEAKRKRRERE